MQKKDLLYDVQPNDWIERCAWWLMHLIGIHEAVTIIMHDSHSRT